MTNLIIKKTINLTGTIRAPPSKSITHRAFIATSLSEGKSKIRNPLMCYDTLATINGCRLLGAKIEQTRENVFMVQGISNPRTPADIINCHDSAATMRFLTPVCALADGISTLIGGESLCKRPMKPVLGALRQLGVKCNYLQRDGYPPIIIHGGGIKGGKAKVRGDVSSQFISGLLIAAPLAKGDTDIILSTPLESKPYVKVTLGILEAHGIKVEAQPDFSRFHVPCKQKYTPSDHTIEGDFSSAAFILVASVITGSHLRVQNLKKDTLQGDRMIVDLLKKMNVLVKTGKDFVEVQSVKGSLKPVDVDLRDNPDLVPVCAVLLCLASGMSTIRGIRRLRFKESNRIVTLTSELMRMGANIRVVDDVLEVDGPRRLHSAKLDSHGDHRIAMACAVAALMAEGDTVIHGIECINKSYPNFVRDMISIGGQLVEQ